MALKGLRSVHQSSDSYPVFDMAERTESTEGAITINESSDIIARPLVDQRR